MTRREVLVLGAGALTLAACGRSSTPVPSGPGGAQILPTDPAVERREAARRRSGAGTVAATVTASEITAVVGGREVTTWSFGDRPGAGAIRAKVGDVVEAVFENRVSTANTLHWHGIALRNDMDGVHHLTQAAVEPGSDWTYRFVVPDAGTYWFHPHAGLELDRGLYAPLVVEDPDEPLDVDVDVTLVLDDWLDGWGPSPDEVLAGLRGDGGSGSQHTHGGDGGMDHSAMAGLGGDVTYPLHLVNGRAPVERETVSARQGQRLRVRIVNAGSDTAYRVAIAEHRLTVTHADGFPVEPVEVDAIVLGMGERYDVVVTAGSGAFAIVAVPEGKDDPAGEAVLRTSDVADPPPVGTRPSGLAGRVLAYEDLVPAAAVRLEERPIDRESSIRLTADPAGYVHGIDDRPYPEAPVVPIWEGQRFRLRVVNETMMFHPVHLHGHTFALGPGGARKDTVNVLPMSSVELDIEADNPGQWMIHCHNTYHFETGMATVLSYRV